MLFLGVERGETIFRFKLWDVCTCWFLSRFEPVELFIWKVPRPQSGVRACFSIVNLIEFEGVFQYLLFIVSLMNMNITSS